MDCFGHCFRRIFTLFGIRVRQEPPVKEESKEFMKNDIKDEKDKCPNGSIPKSDVKEEEKELPKGENHPEHLQKEEEKDDLPKEGTVAVDSKTDNELPKGETPPENVQKEEEKNDSPTDGTTGVDSNADNELPKGEDPPANVESEEKKNDSPKITTTDDDMKTDNNKSDAPSGDTENDDFIENYLKSNDEKEPEVAGVPEDTPKETTETEYTMPDNELEAIAQSTFRHSYTKYLEEEAKAE